MPVSPGGFARFGLFKARKSHAVKSCFGGTFAPLFPPTGVSLCISPPVQCFNIPVFYATLKRSRKLHHSLQRPDHVLSRLTEAGPFQRLHRTHGQFGKSSI